MTATLPARVPSSVGPAVDAARVAHAILMATDGATIGAHGAPYKGDGILVGLPEYGAVLDVQHTPGWDALVDAWIERVAPVVTEHGASPARYFGAWYGPDGRLYLDVVEAFSSADEDLAIAAGRRRNQIAVWHNGRQCEIPTGGTGQLPQTA